MAGSAERHHAELRHKAASPMRTPDHPRALSEIAHPRPSPDGYDQRRRPTLAITSKRRTSAGAQVYGQAWTQNDPPNRIVRMPAHTASKRLGRDSAYVAAPWSDKSCVRAATMTGSPNPGCRRAISTISFAPKPEESDGRYFENPHVNRIQAETAIDLHYPTSTFFATLWAHSRVQNGAKSHESFRSRRW